GSDMTPRHFAVDLDKDRPVARTVPAVDRGARQPAVTMPYRVSTRDPEELLVSATTAGCDCRWYLELDWSSQGRTGTVRIDDHGRPFRTSAITGLPHYWYGMVGDRRQWTPVTG
ncbi:MAG TPA: transcriptional regulator, partial [Streptomyces sp.]